MAEQLGDSIGRVNNERCDLGDIISFQANPRPSHPDRGDDLTFTIPDRSGDAAGAVIALLVLEGIAGGLDLGDAPSDLVRIQTKSESWIHVSTLVDEHSNTTWTITGTTSVLIEAPLVDINTEV